MISIYFKEKPTIEPEVWEQIMFFTLIITVEFKKGEFLEGFKDKRERLLQLNYSVLGVLRNLQSENEKHTLSYSEKFFKNYLDNIGGKYQYLYHFYESIFQHITTGYLNVDKFLKEFEPSPDKAYTDSLYKLKDYLTLSEAEIDKYVKIVLDGLDKGIYNIYSHQNIFHILFDLLTNGIINQTVEEIKEKIYSSLDKAKLRDDDFQMEYFGPDITYQKDNNAANEIFLRIKEINTEHFLNLKRSNVLSILPKLREEKANFLDIIRPLNLVNLSEFFSVEKLLSEINSASNYTTTKFFWFLAGKYKDDDYQTTKDLVFIEKLNKRIESKIKTDSGLTPLRISILKEGLNVLDVVYKEMKSRVDIKNNTEDNIS